MRIIKKKILFGITNLTIGGAERVLVDVCNELCDRYDITIFTIYDRGELKKELNSQIKIKTIYKKRYDELSKLEKFTIPLKILFFSKFIYNKKIKGDYDKEIAFLEGPITRLFSNSNMHVEKIAWVHNDIGKVFGNNLKSIIKKNIDKKIYKKFDKIVFVSEDNRNNFMEKYPDIKDENLYVVPNYINKYRVLNMADELVNYRFNGNVNFVTVCRLVKQKAIDRLIEVHTKLIKEGLMHKFYIIGDGPEKNKLEELINKNNVQDTFILMGKKENPYPYIKMADYFCLLSYFEGYGMVIEEAKILNKKIIITNTAARETVSNYKKSVILENDDTEIYNGLFKILKTGNDNIYYEESNYDSKENLNKLIEVVGD